MFSLCHLTTVLLCVSSAVTLITSLPPVSPDTVDKAYHDANDPNPVLNFQIREPVFTPLEAENGYGCMHTQTLMEHDFGFSYGHPFVGGFILNVQALAD